jgi:hypothetical protein
MIQWEDTMPTSRRTLLKTSAAAAAAFSLDWTRAQAQAETVRIGLIYDLTGPFAAGGSVASSIGAQIAIDLVNEKGGIGGKNKIASSGGRGSRRGGQSKRQCECKSEMTHHVKGGGCFAGE